MDLGHAIQKATDLLKAADSLLEEALLLDGEESPMMLRGEMRFITGTATGDSIVLAVPSEDDFFGGRLNVFLQKRTLSLTAPTTQSDIVFQPADWLPTNDWVGATLKDAGATIQISDHEGDYNKVPVHVNQLFSTRHGVLALINVAGWTGATTPVTAWVAGLDFPFDYVLPRGKSMTINVATLYSAPDSSTTTRVEFRAVAVFTGFKRVRRPS